MSLISVFSKFRRKFHKTSKGFVDVGYWLVIVLTALICGLYISLNLCATALSSGINSNGLLMVISKLSLGVFYDNVPETTDQKFIPLVLSLSNVFSYTSTGLFFVISFWGAIKGRFRDAEKRRVVIHEISNEEEAFPILENYYKDGQDVVAFSGDYSFLLKHSGLREAMLRLAEDNKLKMYSYKSLEEIEEKFSSKFEDRRVFEKIKARIIPNHPVRIKASLIKGNGSKLFLYASEEFHDDGGKIKKICAVLSRNEMQYLLDVLEDLVRFNGVKNKAVKKEAEAPGASD